MTLLKRDGYSLHIQHLDHRTHRDLLFIHDVLGSNRWWELLLERYPRDPNSQHRTILAEWRGCGGSTLEQATNSMSMDGLVQDYKIVADELQVKEWDVVGHGLGALIALRFGLTYPNLVKNLVLMSPLIPEATNLPKEWITELEHLHRDRDYCFEHFPELLQARVLGDSRLMVMLAHDAMRAHPSIWTSFPSFMKSLRRADFSGSQLKVRTLVIQGEDDQFVDTNDCRAFATTLKGAQFKSIPNIGHCLQLENPEKCRSLIQDFLFES